MAERKSEALQQVVALDTVREVGRLVCTPVGMVQLMHVMWYFVLNDNAAGR